MTPQDYLTGWLVYCVGVLGLMVCWWRLTRNIPWPEWRTLLRLSAAVLMLTPYSVDAEEFSLAPAIIISLFEGLIEGPAGMLRAGAPLLIALSLAVALSFALEFLRTRWQRQSSEKINAQILEAERRELLAESLRVGPVKNKKPLNHR